MITIEHTDTFGGDANYCWANRWHTSRHLSDAQLVKLAKQLTGLTGIPCRREDWGDTIALYPRGICQVVFIAYAFGLSDFVVAASNGPWLAMKPRPSVWRCGYAYPGTYGHECGAPAVCVAVKKSDLTSAGKITAVKAPVTGSVWLTVEANGELSS